MTSHHPKKNTGFFLLTHLQNDPLPLPPLRPLWLRSPHCSSSKRTCRWSEAKSFDSADAFVQRLREPKAAKNFENLVIMASIFNSNLYLQLQFFSTAEERVVSSISSLNFNLQGKPTKKAKKLQGDDNLAGYSTPLMPLGDLESEQWLSHASA